MGAPTDIQAGRPLALAFHKLLPKLSYGVTNFAPRRFERLLDSLIDAGHRLVKPDEPETGAEDGRSLLVSFDDGYQHLAETLPPLIERHRLRPLIFVPTALIGRPNTWDYSHRFCPTNHLDTAAIRSLAEQGVIFGSHGRTHRDLTGLSDSDLRAELADSRKLLQDLTGQAVDAISYPFGRSDPRVRETAEACGYRFGYTMAFPVATDTPLALGRIPVYSFDTVWSIDQKITHGWAYPLERLKAGIIGRLSGGTVLLNRLRG